MVGTPPHDFGSFASWLLLSDEADDIPQLQVHCVDESCDEFELIQTPGVALRCTPGLNVSKKSYWTPSEDDFVIAYYSVHGPLWREMSLALAAQTSYTRSDDALRNRHDRLTAQRHNCLSSSKTRERPPRVPWTSNEDETIGANVQTSNIGCAGRAKWRQLAAKLPGRTPHAVRNRANRLAIAKERANAARVYMQTVQK